VGPDVGCNGGGLKFRTSAGGLSAASLGGYSEGGCAGPWANRMEGIKYTSPTLAGFQFVASWTRDLKDEAPSSDGTVRNWADWGHEGAVTLRYAGEFSGVRVAANVGYSINSYDRDPGAAQYSNGDSIVTNGAALGIAGNYASGRTKLFDIGGALMHVPTGLFVQADYSQINYESQDPTTGSLGIPGRTSSNDATRWHIQGGVARNWFGIGNTTLYVEYLKHNNFLGASTQYTTSAAGCGAVTYTSTCDYSNGATRTVANLASDSVKTFGLGVQQAVDAAAMDLYLNWRRHTLDDGAAGSYKDLDVITTGARIRF